MWHIYNFWDGIFVFFSQISLGQVFRMFWFFFVIEFPRYILLDMIVLIHNELYPEYSDQRLKSARYRLFNERPLVSILVPGKNEGKYIYTLFRSLRGQTYTNYELIVVDDGSDDNTAEYCASFIKNGIITKFLRNEIRGGKASAANFAAIAASGEYLVHLDADSSLDSNALEEILLPFFVDSRIGGVGGNVVARNYDKNLITQLQSLEYLQTIMLARIVTSRLGIYRTISGAYGAFKTDILKKIGYWDIGPGLDGDITQKLRKLNYKIYFADKAVCRTNVPEKLWVLTKQRLRWNKSLVRFRVIKHSDIFVAHAEFSLTNMLSNLENIFFNLIASILWIYYIVTLVFIDPMLLLYVFGIKVLFNAFFKVIKTLMVSHLLGHEKSQMATVWFITPLMSLYMGSYMRIVRIVAYFQEAFDMSYKDPWNPEKTSIQARKFGL